MLQVMDLRPLINQKYLVERDLNGLVGNCVVLPISEAPNQGVCVLGEEIAELPQHVGLDVAGLFQQLFFHCWQELLRLGQQHSINFSKFPYILLGELIQRHRPHGQPNNLIPIGLHSLKQLPISIMQVMLAREITKQAAQIIPGEGAVDIADQQPVVLAVQVDLGCDGH